MEFKMEKEESKPKKVIRVTRKQIMTEGVLFGPEDSPVEIIIIDSETPNS